MKAVLHESQLEMRSSLASGVFCVSSNLPVDQHKMHKHRAEGEEASARVTRDS